MSDLIPGSVFWAKPDPTIGVEQTGRRPYIAVAGKRYLENVTNLVLAVPTTTKLRGWPNNVKVSGSTGLDRESFPK